MSQTCDNCGGELSQTAEGRGISKVIYSCQDCGNSGFYHDMVAN